MFLDLDKKDKEKVAVVDDSGQSITYGDICDFSVIFAKYITARTIIFILSENKIGSLLGYTAALSNRVVPLIISAKTDSVLYENLKDIYKPEYIWLPKELEEQIGYEVVFSVWDYVLVKTDYKKYNFYEELSLLLPTSGSTGSPKLVRHSYRNIEANAYNVMRLFNLSENEKAMAILPMHYTMGLSVITSHLFAGATILLSKRSLLDRDFWVMLKEATSFTGVPYSYELMVKMRFTRMNLPNLKIITQGGGKLTEELFQLLAKYAVENGKKFIPTYGQSECTARMAYLPAELSMTKTCSIGIAEPGGQLSIIDEEGVETFDGIATGEMVYRGENVTLGYANSQADLLKGDENHGLAAIMMTIETRASHQHVDALSTAEEARLSPIRMMIGPVTIGGRNFITFLTPTALTIRARIRYRRPAITIPPQAYWSFSAAAIVAYLPSLSEETEANPPRNANEEPRNAGTLNFAKKWKRRVPRPAISSVVWIESGSPKL